MDIEEISSSFINTFLVICSLKVFKFSSALVDFPLNKFSSKTLDEVKELYRSQSMKENLEFIKESIKKILYR